MSNEMNQHELVSAYFDGELSADDRLRAERALEESPDIRREIDEIAELSELVKSLPVETAPPELLPAILRRAERETLLPAVEPPAVEPPVVAARMPRKSRAMLGAGVAAAAALVLVAVQWLPDRTPTSPEGTVADAPSMESAPSARLSQASGARAERSALPADAAERRADEGVSGDPIAAAAPQAAARGSVADREAEGALESKARGLPGGPLPRPSVKQAMSLNADALKDARQGDQLLYFSTSGTKVTTYVVTVVDVKRALNQMQVLLARNDIPAREADAIGNANDDIGRSAGNDGAADKTTEPSEQLERLFAVYVETTPDRFTSALKDLLDDELFAELQPKPPVDKAQIEVAELGRPRRQLFAESEAAVRGGKLDAEDKPARRKVRSAGKEKADAKEPLPASPPKPQPAEDADAAKPGEADADLSRDKKKRQGESRKRFAQAEPSGFLSYQMQVELAPLPPALDGRSDSRRRANASDEAERRVPLRARQEDAADERKPAEEELRDDAVRVLFVFREAPKPGS